MAHFAELDSDNRVMRVIVVANEDAINEETGVAFCQKLFGADTTWVQTSYNANVRGKFAGVGDLYDKKKNKFVVDEVWQGERKKIIDAQLAEQQAIEDAKKVTLAKLEKLGLTADDLKNILQ